jgi:hypothetical protein
MLATVSLCMLSLENKLILYLFMYDTEEMRLYITKEGLKWVKFSSIVYLGSDRWKKRKKCDVL